ncbi:MAG: ORF6N domain-containing protein [Ginsengibacter sp.]
MPKAKLNITALMPDENIIRKIFVIREQKVMLDFDLAALYEVGTRRLNEQVKRNIDRFPKDFMFRLNAKEWQTMRSQIATSSPQRHNYQPLNTMMSQNATSSQSKRQSGLLPYAFTEHGVTMLASVLKSERAVKMSIAVVRAFIELKKSIFQYNQLATKIETLQMHLGEHDVQLNSIYEAIENLLDDKVDNQFQQDKWKNRKRIGFKPGE